MDFKELEELFEPLDENEEFTIQRRETDPYQFVDESDSPPPITSLRASHKRSASHASYRKVTLYIPPSKKKGKRFSHSPIQIRARRHLILPLHLLRPYNLQEPTMEKGENWFFNMDTFYKGIEWDPPLRRTKRHGFFSFIECAIWYMRRFTNFRIEYGTAFFTTQP